MYKLIWNDLTWFGKITIYIPLVIFTYLMLLAFLPIILVLRFYFEKIEPNFPEWANKEYNVFFK